MNFLLNRDERVYLRVQREVTESKNSFIFLFSLKMFVTHTLYMYRVFSLWTKPFFVTEIDKFYSKIYF